MDECTELVERILQMDGRLFEFRQSGLSSEFLSLDLTMPQLKVLLILYASGGATGGQLARALGVGLSTMTGIADRLCDHGLVTRGEDPDDRRATRVVLTAEGRALMERLHRYRHERVASLLARLDLDALRTVARAFDHLHSAMLSAAVERGLAVDGVVGHGDSAPVTS